MILIASVMGEMGMKGLIMLCKKCKLGRKMWMQVDGKRRQGIYK